MTPEQLHERVSGAADFWWAELRKFYPTISKVRPAIKYNKRLKTTAGRAFIYDDPAYIDLSVDLLWEYPGQFTNDTIAHEYAHIVAFKVYQDPGHGIGWKTVMRSIGLEPNRCHQMVNSKHEARKAGIKC